MVRTGEQGDTQRVTGKCSKCFGLENWKNTAGIVIKANPNSKPLNIQVRLFDFHSNLRK